MAITHEINFESAAARVCVPITLKDDSRAQERNKTFPVTLRYSSGVDSITVTIKDDGTAHVLLYVFNSVLYL